MDTWIEKLLENKSLRALLFWIVFLSFPLVARAIQALKKRAAEARGERPPPLAGSSRTEVEDLERDGGEAWRRLLRGEEPAPREAPAPAPPPPAPATRRPVSLEDLGRELEREPRPISLEDAPGDAAPPLEGEALVPAMASDVGGEAFPAALTDGPAAEPALAGARLGAVERPPEPVPAEAAFDPGGWRRAFVLSEVLAPPLSLRRESGGLALHSEPS